MSNPIGRPLNEGRKESNSSTESDEDEVEGHVLYSRESVSWCPALNKETQLTFQFSVGILQDEVEHSTDRQSLRETVSKFVARCRNRTSTSDDAHDGGIGNLQELSLLFQAQAEDVEWEKMLEG